MTEGGATRYVRVLRERSPADNARRVAGKLARAYRRTAARIAVTFGTRYLAGERLRAALVPGAEPGDMGKRATEALMDARGETARGRRAATAGRFFLDADSRQALVAAVERMQPGARESAVEDAERVLRHEFDLLGWGPVDWGEEIDWHRDPMSGFRWPERAYRGEIRRGDVTPGSDVKVPWELSRAQYLPTLGRAYWHTGDERFPAEFVDIVDDWLEHNPPETGVNWSCPMEAAIRAANWLFAYHLMADSPAVDAGFEERLLGGLYEHGRHIARNLEGAPGDVNSNHYLADITGLLFLGVLLPELAESAAWRAASVEALAREMRDEVLPEGPDWELSTSYHRLVTEMFMTCAILCERNGIGLPTGYRERLESMLDYTFHYTRPDGTAPLIGDADDGRLLRLTTWTEPRRASRDHRHLLAAGSVLFERPEWAAAAGDQWEEALWLLGSDAAEKAEGLLSRAGADPAAGAAGSKAFPAAGVYVMRTGDLYSIANVGSAGVGGPTDHFHNDLLSFEVFAGGAPFLVDPGSYVYTADPQARNAFRSSRTHNGPVVDGEETDRFEAARLFAMPRRAAPRVERWESDPKKDHLVARHEGYARLSDPATVRRAWLFDKARGLWVVRDRVEAVGEHRCIVPLQLAPGVTIDMSGDGATARAASGATLEMRLLKDPGVTLGVEEGSVSLAYGTRVPAPRLEIAFTTRGTTDLVWALVPVAAGAGPDDVGERLRASAELFTALDAPVAGTEAPR